MSSQPARTRSQSPKPLPRPRAVDSDVSLEDPRVAPESMRRALPVRELRHELDKTIADGLSGRDPGRLWDDVNREWDEELRRQGA